MTHQDYLLHSLKLAKQRQGFCAPNPAVGCVIVKDNTIIGEGHHHGAGQPHAEVNALHQAGDNAKGATLYVTLEPCCHFGRTPPCVNAIIKAGIKAVYCAFQDPNPVVAGQGMQTLIANQIPCDLIQLEEIDYFYRAYQHWTRTEKPYVIAKIAISSNNKIALADSSPAQITGPELKTFTHQQRLMSDAILTTINTVKYDDPQLNVRLNQQTITKPIYVLDRQLQLPITAQLIHTSTSLTLFHQADINLARKNQLTQLGIHLIEIPTQAEQLDLIAIINALGQAGLHQIWIEAGAQLFNSLLEKRLANELYIYHGAAPLPNNALNSQINSDQLNQQYNQLVNNPAGKDRLTHWQAKR